MNKLDAFLNTLWPQGSMNYLSCHTRTFFETLGVKVPMSGSFAYKDELLAMAKIMEELAKEMRESCEVGNE